MLMQAVAFDFNVLQEFADFADEVRFPLTLSSVFAMGSNCVLK